LRRRSSVADDRKEEFMSLRETPALLALATGLAVVSASAHAADQSQTGAYVGASVGQAEYVDACSGVSDLAASLGQPSSCDDKDIAFKIYGGYRITPWLAGEIGFTNPGKTTATIGSANAEIKGWLVPIYAVGILPIANDRVWLMAKAGGVYWDLKASASDPGGSFSQSDNGFSFAYGVGAQYNFNPHLGVRAEFEVFHDVGNESTTGQGDIRMWSIGVVWRF
jgi:opacity protein-like surface antigen